MKGEGERGGRWRGEDKVERRWPTRDEGGVLRVENTAV